MRSGLKKAATLLPLVGFVVLACWSARRNRTADSSSPDASSSLPVCRSLLNTRKHLTVCYGPEATVFPLLVTGLGGSGTHAVARRLREMGVDVDHEHIATHGAVAWMYAVNDIVIGQPYPFRARLIDSSIDSPRFERVVHVVRCPMNQISSLTSHTKQTYDFIFRGMRKFNLSASDRDLVVRLFPQLLLAL